MNDLSPSHPSRRALPRLAIATSTGALVIAFHMFGSIDLAPIVAAALWFATALGVIATGVCLASSQHAALHVTATQSIAARLVDPIGEHLEGDLATWWNQADVEQRCIAIAHAAQTLSTAEQFAKKDRFASAAAWLRSGRGSALFDLVEMETGLSLDSRHVIDLAEAVRAAHPDADLDELGLRVGRAAGMLQPGQ